MLSQRNIETFTRVLRAKGAATATRYLNGGVPHRYTAAYALLDGNFHNFLLYDKLGEVRAEYLAVVPFEMSFCQFVLREGFFCSDDTARDKRLNGNPHQGIVVSYHAVPLISSTADFVGTLCHFDTRQLRITDIEYELLQQAAHVLAEFLPLPWKKNSLCRA